MAGFRIEGNTSGNVAEVTTANMLKVVPETDAWTNPANVGTIRAFSENDTGVKLGTPQLLSPETDLDYRLRIANDAYLDNEIFNYAAQNTGKIQYANTTMTIDWSLGAGQRTNASGITTATTGARAATYAFFPISGTSTISLDIEASFNTTPVSNTTIDFGMFLPGAANPYAPTDGVYFRLTSAGLQGVTNFNGSETTTSVMAFTITPNKKYQFILYLNQRVVEFWINDGASTDMYGKIVCPDSLPQPCASASLPVAWRHAIGAGAAGGVLQFSTGSYNVRLGGPNVVRTMGEMGNAIYGAYQGLSGGTMGTLANFANSANPTAAVPTNTTAALGTGLGGQFWETDTLAVTTDGIIDSYRVPAGTTSVQGRRLKISGVKIHSFIQTALTGGGYVGVWSLAFGHTAVSLATAEAAATKAARRVPLGVHAVGAAAAASTVLAEIKMDFDNPIYVNPGEFVAIVKKKVGTAPTAGVVAHIITLDYSWE